MVIFKRASQTETHRNTFSMKSTSPSVSETWMSSTWLSSRTSSSWDHWNSYRTSTDVTGIADTMSALCTRNMEETKAPSPRALFQGQRWSSPIPIPLTDCWVQPPSLKEKSGRTAEILRHLNCWQEHTTTDPKQLHVQTSYCSKKKARRAKGSALKNLNFIQFQSTEVW